MKKCYQTTKLSHTGAKQRFSLHILLLLSFLLITLANGVQVVEQLCPIITLGEPTVSECGLNGNTPVSTVTVEVFWSGNASSGELILVELTSGSILSTNPVFINPATESSPQVVTFDVLADGTSGHSIEATSSSACSTANTSMISFPERCCQGSSATICTNGANSATLSIDDGLTQIQWFNESGVLMGETGPTLVVDATVEPFATDLADGEEYYHYTATSANGCSGILCCPVLIRTEVCYDLALTKMLNTSETPGPFNPGDQIQFTFEITNQGTRTVYGVDVIDYVPDGLLNIAYVPNSATQGTITQNGTTFTLDVLPGMDSNNGEVVSMSFDVEFTIDPTFTGGSLRNIGEISAFFQDAGRMRPAIDEDSTPDDNLDEDVDEELENNNVITDIDNGSVMDDDDIEDDFDVEEIIIGPLLRDYGDLADTGIGTGEQDYQTTIADDGPSHAIINNISGQPVLTIGTLVDGENDGQPGVAADGDGADDDGFDPTSVLFVREEPVDMEVSVTNITGNTAKLTVFIDWNNNGDFTDAGEMFFVDVPDQATSVTLAGIIPPADATLNNDTGLRIRLSTDMAASMSPTGQAPDGEVEDYMIQVLGLDYGDLPDSYVTTGESAPHHIVNESLTLGTCVDVEAGGIPEAMAGAMEGGDDADLGQVTFGTCTNGDDEDGITFTHPFIPGNESCVTVTATNMTGEEAILQMWIDWNGNGMFDTDEEVAFTDNTVPVGGVDEQAYCFSVPDEVAYSEGTLFIRTRLSPDGGLASNSQTGVAPLGEIEDYNVVLSKFGNLVWEDFNGNGVQDEDSSLGINGVDVELLWYGPDGDVNTTTDNRTYTVTTATVDGNPGLYAFCGLITGNYSLDVPTLPGTFVSTWSDIPGNDQIDSDENTGIEFTIVDPLGLLEGENGISDNPGEINNFPDNQDDLTFDFGVYIPAEIGDFVWLDEDFENADNTQVNTGGVSDTPIEGVTVTLMGTDNIGQTVMDTRLTDANGLYRFIDLPPGSYRLMFDASTALDDCGPILLAVTPDVSTDDLDSDQDQASFTTPFYELFSGDNNFTVDGGFVEPVINLACIANLNVTLTDSCEVLITPAMVLSGELACIDNFIVSVDDQLTDVVTGCGNHTYSITVIEDEQEVYTCWGNIFAEDKTAPVVECPVRAGTGTADVPMTMQTATGTLDNTDPTLVMRSHSCFSDAFSPAVGDRPYDLITFTVTDTDVYNIGIVGDGFNPYLAIFAGEFNPGHPCSNVIATNDDNYNGDLSLLDDVTLEGPRSLSATRRLTLPLQPGLTYTLMIANAADEPVAFGDWEVVVVSDRGNSVINPDVFGNPTTVTVEKDLLCTDVDQVLFENTQSWVVNADGSLNVQASLAFFSSIAELNAFVSKLSLIGVPVATDNCSDVLITVSDMLMEEGDCGEIAIMRTFRATSSCGLTGDEGISECSMRIEFRRPNVRDIILPPFTAPIECDETFATDGSIGGPDDNPAASVTGYPWIQGAFGNYDLAESLCNVGANYSDEPRLNVCEGTYTFRREWNIIDWCAAGQSFEWDQIVKVGDFTAPEFTIPNFPISEDGGDDDDLREIIVSTSPFDCVAYVLIPELEITDNCAGAGGGTYKITEEGGAVIATGSAGDGDATSVPIGNHLIEICAEDECGNQKCEAFNLMVRDMIEPFATCDDQLNISISGGDIASGVSGVHRLLAEVAAEGSSDNCSEVTLLIRREIMDPQNYDCLDQFDYNGDGRVINDELRRDPDNISSPNGWFTPWLPYADFTCCDVGILDNPNDDILVEVQVTDEAGNSNVCWQYVEPEDKLAPFCRAPANQMMSCLDLPLALPGDIVAAYDEDPIGTVTTLNALFGEPTATDNCRVDTLVENRPVSNLNDCGWGTLTRRFEVWQLKPEGDVNGNGRIDREEVVVSTNNCSQLITITETHEFTIDFPEDAAANCADPCIPEIEITMPGCDNVLVNQSEPQIFAANGEECYKLAITYDVINWCIWDGEYEGTVIKRRTEDDGEALPIDRAVESAERPVLRFVGPDRLDLEAELDRRHQRRRTCDVNVPGDDSRMRDQEIETGDDIYAFEDNEDWRGILAAGRWQYTQFIKVYDETAPEVLNISYNRDSMHTAQCTQDWILEDWQFVDPFGGCGADVNITFDVTDICDGLDGAVENITLVSAELDGFAVDVNADGQISFNEFLADSIPFNLSTNDGRTYIFSGNFPVIEDALGDSLYHALRVVFEDGCGNRASDYIEFDIIDCKGPAPICLNGITVTLMPQLEGGCAMTAWANDFEASPIYDCTGQGPEVNPNNPEQERVTEFAIYRQSTVENDSDFVPNPDDRGLALTEEDLGRVFIYIYGFDEEGNYDFCTTYIQVEAHTDCGISEGANLAGVIQTEEATTIEFAEVNLSGGMQDVQTTGVDGTFSFAGLTEGGDYTVTPFRNDDHDNGVTTFDIVLISKHILGTDPLDSPYKMIAADVNNSGTVSTLDLIQIRKLILNIEIEFSDNTSWRFVTANYTFPKINNPWSEVFPELYNINNLVEDMTDADFVGIKIGDVNGNAVANSEDGDDRTLNGTFHLEMDELELRAGNTYEIPVYASELATTEGYQGTLNLHDAELVDIIYGVSDAKHFGLQFAAQGVVTMSYNKDESITDRDAILFTLVLKSNTDQPLSEALSIGSRYTAAEAYSLGGIHRNLDLQFNGRFKVPELFQLYQNTPNPVANDGTLISFYLPKAGVATLVISDLNGRPIWVQEAEYDIGFHTVNLRRKELGTAAGVLNYTLTSGKYTDTRQMVVIE